MAQYITSQQIAQANAFTRAEEQAALGVRPHLIGSTVNERGILCESVPKLHNRRWRAAARMPAGWCFPISGVAIQN